MIRSLIGIVFVLVSVTTSFTSTATASSVIDSLPLIGSNGERSAVDGSLEQAFGWKPLRSGQINARPENLRFDQLLTDRLRGDDFNSGDQGPIVAGPLGKWLRLAGGGAGGTLRSSTVRDDFRFRASPVKGPRNWEMPDVVVRPAKMIGPPTDRRSGRSLVIRLDKQISRIVIRVRNISAAGLQGATLAFDFRQQQFEQSAQAAVERLRELDPRFVFDGVQNLAFFKGGTGVGPSLDSKPDIASISRSGNRKEDRSSTGQVDYWSYYADCDRWNVVFAKAEKAVARVEVAGVSGGRLSAFDGRTFFWSQSEVKQLLTAIGVDSSETLVERR